MNNTYYTTERNVQIVIALLKAHGIRRVIASPGTTNMTFIVSIQNDPFFQIWSSVDERSAAYLACGIASETNEPVVISCTGATASRNYMPGLTEAYYRKLPVLAITSHRGTYTIGHLIDQQIDRRQIPSDIAIESVTVPEVKCAKDERFCEIEANKAMLALRFMGGGPAHINLFTSYSKDFSCKEIKHVHAIFRYTTQDELPSIPQGQRVAISLGAHQPFTEKQTTAIDRFCATYNAVVFTDHTGGYHGKYEVNYALVCGQKQKNNPQVDLLIHIGEVTGDCYMVRPKNVWRVSPDGAIRDKFRKLSKVFMMTEEEFFEFYGKDGCSHTEFLDECKKTYDDILSKIPDLPFSNIWIAQQIANKLPEGCDFHTGIYNSLRSYNFFQIPQSINERCNVGGFGIDGGISTMIGASMVSPEKIHIGVFGDLAFFYDMNVLGNRHVGNNVRIMLINNGKGQEFRNYNHPCYFLGEAGDEFVAASGHYGNKSKDLVRHYATDLGYQYLSASSKEEFLGQVDTFLNPEITSKPILFEVFTAGEDESMALKQILNIIEDPKQQMIEKMEQVSKRLIGEKGVQTIKKLLE